MQILKYTLLSFIILMVASCTQDFEEINTNPNAPVEVQPSLLLRQVIYNYGDEMHFEGFTAGNLLGQYFTEVDFNLFDRHSLAEPQIGGNPWPILYTNLRNNELLLEQALTIESARVYEGPARILKAYMAATLTDIFGDVPYSEALKGQSGNVTPAYDAQEDIYTGVDGIIANLNMGIAAIKAYDGNIALGGDILYDGDLDAWVRFANSLKLKYLLRISDRGSFPAELSSVFFEGDYIKTNDQNATFQFTDGQPNNFRMANLRAGDFNLFIMSETMEEILTEYNDPRQDVFFRSIGNDPTGTVYKGYLNGFDASQTSISIADYSLTGTVFRENTGDLEANFMTAWETQLIIAEAATIGLIFSNGKVHYDEGVSLAFEYWKTEMPENYLTTGPTAFGNGNEIEQIITQKWLANIINGYEGWIEYRRTGFPVLKTLAASLNDDLIPVRMPYPVDEAALNTESYNAATATNGNSINARVWWDVD